MTYTRPRIQCGKDSDIFVKNIYEGSSKKVRIAKSKNFDCAGCFGCDLCSCGIGTSNSSGDEKNFSKNHLNKQNKFSKSGSVNKVPLGRGIVKSSPCINYHKVESEAAHDPRNHKKKILKHKSNTNHIEDDIDFIPVKLNTSEKILPFKSNDSMKMNSVRQNLNSRSPDRKVNSWGRLLKEQNAPKELKKTTAVTPQIPKQKSLAMASRNQPNINVKERNANLNTPTQQVRTNKNKQVVKDNYPVMKKKSSHHTLRFEAPNNRSEYSSGSSTSITGESIMLVDRSAQCSATNLEGLDANIWSSNLNDINQAGDSGLAFLNPVRTLNFLVRELRGKVSEGSEDDNMARIIRDMESTIARLTKSPQGSASQDGVGNVVKENWNTIISEEDLKFVLELLQNSPHIVKMSETEKNAVELQQKLEGTCNKLEELCKFMEKTTCHKLREDKQRLDSEIKLKKEELEAAVAREKRHEQIIAELKKKNEEQSKQIASLKENQSKAAALNAILNEQLQDTEKKYQQVVTEMQFLILEKEKNLVLMKCKDQDIQEMRKNLEEIKSLVVQHLTSFQLDSTNSGTALCKDNKLDFDNMTLISTLSETVLHKDVNGVKNELPICSSPVETLSPSPGDDESWRKISNVALTVVENPVLLQQDPQPNLIQVVPLQQQSSKTACIKESLKNLFEEMKRQTKLGKNLSVQNLINLDDPISLGNWSDLDLSDEEVRSITVYGVSGSETNLSK